METISLEEFRAQAEAHSACDKTQQGFKETFRTGFPPEISAQLSQAIDIAFRLGYAYGVQDSVHGKLRKASE